MKKHFLLLFLIFTLSAGAQTNVVIDASVRYQTIQGFGASDAWNVDFVGKYWTTSVKDQIAKKLFARTFDGNGNPEGIGLSRWRFNIGGGSSEQGNSSKIDEAERRVECFLNADNTYNWKKQAGQQWFLNQAKSYGVEQLVGFVNSPPRFYTKNGRTNSDNTNAFGSTNLKDGYYEKYAAFLATVLKHFENNGIHFAQISPVNEPQWKWDSGQEGCPWYNTEIKQLTGVLNKALLDSGLSTKILLAEASSFHDLYLTNGNDDKCNQIEKFFNSSRTEYIGGFSQVLPGIGGHSYWTDTADAIIRTTRENLYRKSQEQGGIELYQTEYNLLSKSYNDNLSNSIFLGKMIYADLSIANVSVWDYWTAIERERWGHRNRFYLIRLIPTGGDYVDLTGGGTISIDKNLWVLGNYSRFIRPGYKRIGTTGADDLAGLMGSAYLAPDTPRIVAVYVNTGTTTINLSQTLSHLPDGFQVKNITPYLTNVTNNLQVKTSFPANTVYPILPRSVTTLVIELGKTPSAIKQLSELEDITVSPNPSRGLFLVKKN